jgi:hypothetical protein
MAMNGFCKSNIMNVILLVVNIAYATIGCYIWIDYFSHLNRLLNNGHGTGGVGMGLLLLYPLVGIACIIFIPLAILTKYRSSGMSKKFYNGNCLAFICISVITILSLFILPSL